MKLSLLSILLMLLVSCSRATKNTEEKYYTIQEKSFHCECSEKLNIRENYVDRFELFSINIPECWWTSEDGLENVHGISSMDSCQHADSTIGISVTLFQMSETELEDQFRNELKSLETDLDPEYELIDYGSYSGSYWVLSHSIMYGVDDFSYLNYVRKGKSDTCYIVHGVVKGSHNWRSRLCQTKQIINSFRILDGMTGPEIVGDFLFVSKFKYGKLETPPITAFPIVSNLIPQGNYEFKISHAEWDGKQFGGKVLVKVENNNVKVIYLGGEDLKGLKKGDLIEAGKLRKHKSGSWMISNKETDIDLDEIGGCSGGPTIIDFEERIYWIC